jgi:hypothetical protein
MSVRGQEHLPAPDELGALFSGCLDGSLDHSHLGLPIGAGFEPVQPFLKNVKRGIRSMNFKALFFVHGADAQIDPSGGQVEPCPVIAALRQVGEFHYGGSIEPQVILSSEVDLGPAVLGLQLIAFDQSKVHDSLLRTQVLDALDDDIALHIGQAGEAVVVIALVLGQGEER